MKSLKQAYIFMQFALLATCYGGLCIFSKGQKLFDSLGYIL